ncbi:MAG: hypothetical protein E6I66_05165 [Chloroflexi bacterium]|nr:MAG: hypothetical protein E6I66_05165 [Chloroflexota bacterium]
MRTPLLDTVPTRKSGLALFPAVIVAALLVLQAGAAASPPLREQGHQDDTVILPGASARCGFPIYGRFEGDFNFTVFYKNGQIEREVDTFPSFKVTVFAPSTGKSYTSASPAVLHTTYTNGAAIGSTAIAALTGLFEKIDGVDMDGGRFVFDAVVVDYDAAGVPLIRFVREISSVGPDLDAPIRFQRCAAMMP